MLILVERLACFHFVSFGSLTVLLFSSYEHKTLYYSGFNLLIHHSPHRDTDLATVLAEV